MAGPDSISHTRQQKDKGKKRKRGPVAAAEEEDVNGSKTTATVATDSPEDGDAPVASTSAAVIDKSEQPKKSKKDKKLRKAEQQAERNAPTQAKAAPPAAAPTASFADVHRPQKPSAKAKAGKVCMSERVKLSGRQV